MIARYAYLTQQLQQIIPKCLENWGDDPAYEEVAAKLKEVERELDVLLESPGQRAARAAMPPAHSGQLRLQAERSG